MGHMLEAGTAIQMHAEDVVPSPGQSPGAGFTEATRRTKDQGPTALANVFRHPAFLQLEEEEKPASEGETGE
jgi:hypothetical protein